MKSIEELVEDCKAELQTAHRMFTDMKYTILGEWHLGEISDYERDRRLRLQTYWYEKDKVSAIHRLAVRSNNPLYLWLVENLESKDTAFHIICRQPKTLKDVDKIAARSRLECTVYNNYRVKVIADGVLEEYK